jgi:undecaprenyl-diphosphatase
LTEFFASIDRSMFYFVNHSLQNILFDAVMPFLTDLNKKPGVVLFVGLCWIVLFVKGGKSGRIAALLLIPTIVLSDQLSSSLLKQLFDRLRPCFVLPDVHLLVPCGSGRSFPSSHAVNNFAGAYLFAYFFPRWRWALYGFAAAVAFSRVYVGVHYPSDVVGGSIIGIGCGALVVLLYVQGEARWKTLRAQRFKPEGK